MYRLTYGRRSGTPRRARNEPQSLMSFAHPETMKMPLWGPFFLAKALRRQEFTGLAPLRPSRLCERVPARRVAAIFRADERRWTRRQSQAPRAHPGDCVCFRFPPKTGHYESRRSTCLVASFVWPPAASHRRKNLKFCGNHYIRFGLNRRGGRLK